MIPFTVNSVLVKDFKISTRNFTNLKLRVLIADKIGQEGGQLSMIPLWTLQSPYIIPVLVITGLKDLLASSDKLLDEQVFDTFFLVDSKTQNSIVFFSINFKFIKFTCVI